MKKTVIDMISDFFNFKKDTSTNKTVFDDDAKFSKSVEIDSNLTVTEQIKIGDKNTYISSTEAKIEGNRVWHEGNDGAGSGLDADLVKGKDFFNLSKHTKMCQFDVESEEGKGNLQGIIIFNNTLYALRNVKDNDAGIISYSPGEKGRIYKFDLQGNLLFKTADLEKVGHQGFSYFISNNKLYFVSSGGTDDGEELQTIKTYAYKEYETYLNAGKHISIIEWNESSNPTINRYRVMDNYNETNIKDTLWFRAVPYVDPETLETVIVFSDPRNPRRRLIRIYSNIYDIINGGYNNYIKEFVFNRDEDINAYYDFQGVAYKNGLIYMLFGSYDSTNIRNREIVVYSNEGHLINVVKIMPNFLDLSKYTIIELEGMSFVNNDIYIGLHVKNINGNYEEYLVKLKEGKDSHNILENIPYSYYSSSDINVFIKPTNFYRIYTWDEYTNNTENRLTITNYGNMRLSGTYLGFMYKPETGSDDFNKVISYDLNGDILRLRAWSDLDTGGAGINLYHKDGNNSNPGGIRFFKSDNGNYIFENLPVTDPHISGAIWNDGGILKVSSGE